MFSIWRKRKETAGAGTTGHSHPNDHLTPNKRQKVEVTSTPEDTSADWSHEEVGKFHLGLEKFGEHAVAELASYIGTRSVVEIQAKLYCFHYARDEEQRLGIPSKNFNLFLPPSTTANEGRAGRAAAAATNGPGSITDSSSMDANPRRHLFQKGRPREEYYLYDREDRNATANLLLQLGSVRHAPRLKHAGHHQTGSESSSSSVTRDDASRADDMKDEYDTDHADDSGAEDDAKGLGRGHSDSSFDEDEGFKPLKVRSNPASSCFSGSNVRSSRGRIIRPRMFVTEQSSDEDEDNLKSSQKGRRPRSPFRVRPKSGRRDMWTADELDILHKGIAKYGSVAIKEISDMINSRTRKQVKDKLYFWRKQNRTLPDKFLGKSPPSSSAADPSVSKSKPRHRLFSTAAKETKEIPQCVKSADGSHNKGPWSVEEIELLESGLQIYGDDPLELHKVADHIGTRTRKQVIDKVSLFRISEEGKKEGKVASRGAWSADELNLLEEGIEMFGPHACKEIVEHIGTRTRKQIQEKLYSIRSRAEGKAVGTWTDEEERKIKGALKEFGRDDISAIARHVGSRTEQQVLVKLNLIAALAKQRK